MGTFIQFYPQNANLEGVGWGGWGGGGGSAGIGVLWFNGIRFVFP